MSYTDKTQLILAYGETDILDLTDRNEAGEIDDAVLAEAIATVTGEINGYLSGRYKLPIATVPAVLRSIANALVFEKLHARSVDDAAAAAAKTARDQLKAINAGKMKLEVEGAETPSSGAGVEYFGSPRVFTDETLGGF